VANPENLRTSSMSSVVEPRDMDGIGDLTKRLNDWTSQDQAWFYVPATRRVRRVSAATRSDPIAGLEAYADDVNCYGGKIEYFHWKLLGEGEVLAPLMSPLLFSQQSSPTRYEMSLLHRRAAYETPGAKGAPWWITENLGFTPRPVWILEGQPE